MIGLRLPILALFLGISSCTNYFPPSPTSRAVTAADLTGSWSYLPIDCDAKVTLVLAADQTFQQTVTLPDETLTQTGKWEIDGSDLDLEGVLMEFRGWKAEGESWRIIDRDESPTGFSILGGSVDPDCWVVFRWVR